MLQSEPREEKFLAEDVFKKPLPPSLKKEESTPPVRMPYLIFEFWNNFSLLQICYPRILTGFGNNALLKLAVGDYNQLLSVCLERW